MVVHCQHLHFVQCVVGTVNRFLDSRVHYVPNSSHPIDDQHRVTNELKSRLEATVFNTRRNPSFMATLISTKPLAVFGGKMSTHPIHQKWCASTNILLPSISQICCAKQCETQRIRFIFRVFRGSVMRAVFSLSIVSSVRLRARYVSTPAPQYRCHRVQQISAVLV